MKDCSHLFLAPCPTLAYRVVMVAITVTCLLNPMRAPAFGFGFGDGNNAQCRTCHLTPPDSGTLRFVSDINGLCRTCHLDSTNSFAGTNSHPTEVATTMTFPEGFWLDEGGDLNCLTCHDPHPVGEDPPFALRGGARDINFCIFCHETLSEDAGWHFTATFLAHTRTYTPPTSVPDTLDRISRDCLSCHDGVGAMSANYCILMENKTCTSHPIGMDYDKAQARNRNLHPRASLLPQISFYEGKVGCATCHSIYSHESKKLVMSNRRSALCFQCHDR